MNGATRAGILDRDGVDALTAQLLGNQREGLGDAGDDEDVVRADPQPADAGQPWRERRAQPRVPARVAVAELVRWRFRQDGALGAQPGGARERRQVGNPGREVDALADR